MRRSAVWLSVLALVSVPMLSTAPTPSASAVGAAPRAVPVLAVAGVPADPAVVYAEDFEAQPSTPVLRLDQYTGGPGTGNATYTADAPWLRDCNGWVAEWNQPTNPAAPVADCKGQFNWNSTQQLAQALGLLRGETTTQARANVAVSAYTSANPGANAIEFQTAGNRTLPTATGRFLTTSIDVAALNCPPVASAPTLQFQLLDAAGTATNVGGVINSCTSTQSVTTQALGAAGTRSARVGTYSSNGSILWNSPTIGLRIRNTNGSGAGNDHAFDNIRIVDGTPTLDKAFSPTTFATGGTTRLTFTITNTSELAAKNGWSFTDNLPAGMTTAATPNATTSCPGSTVTAPGGGTTVRLTGNLNSGMTSCTLGVDVTAAQAGSYTNDASNLAPMVGLNPPGSTTATAVDTDYGDAPASYGTATTSHTLTAGLGIGATRDTEAGANTSSDATGDDTNRADDEDGITGTPVLRPDQAMSIPVAVRNTTGAAATLVGWVDFNADGDVDDPGERSAPVPVPAGATSVTATWASVTGAQAGGSFARFRLYPGTPGAPSPTGAVTGGEVEDHAVTLQVPGISLAKTASAVEDRDNNGVDAGDDITYTLRVTNTGNALLDPVVVNDPLLGGNLACGTGPLAGGASRTCPTVDYTLTQADIDAGTRDNTATVTGTPPSGPTVTANASTSTPLPSTPAITVAKTHGFINDVDQNGTDAGDTVQYSFRVTNSGNRALTDVTVDDAKTGPVSCPATALAPGEATTCTATYVLTQADVNAGRVDNTATVRALGPRNAAVSGSDTDTLVVPARSTLTIDKSVTGVSDTNNTNRRDAGDTVSYSFVVTNTGNTTLTGVHVDDAKVGNANITCPTTTVLPHRSTACTASYVITQADADSGSVLNTATATGTPPTGADITSSPDATSTDVAANPGLRLVKRAGAPVDVDNDGRTDTGDAIDYQLQLTNTGNVTLTGLALADPKLGAGTITCPTLTLAPGASTTCTATYTIAQVDVDAGSVDNAATASGDTPDGGSTTSNRSTTTTPTDSFSALTIDKSVASTTDQDNDNRLDAGDLVNYSFLVTNTGNETVTALTIADVRTGGANCPVTSLAPGASTTCTQSYPVTQADVDAGTITNTATAGGVRPNGNAVVSSADTVTQPTDTVPGLSIDKQVVDTVDVDGSSTLNAGDRVDFAFIVTNTGTVSMTAVAVNDAKVGAGNITCPATTLAPKSHFTCTAPYTVTQADVNAGSVTNSATASGNPPTGGRFASPADTTSTPTSSTSSLSFDKRAGAPTDVDNDGRTDPGDTIDYTFIVTNTGSVTISSIAVTDPKLGSGITCTLTTLDPSQATTCRKTYAITQADVDNGSVDNSASASGTRAGGGQVTSPTDSTSTPTSTFVALSLDKSVSATHDVDTDGHLDAGDTIDYVFLVTNTGVVTTTFVEVDDPKAGAVQCGRTTLAPADTVTCRKTYTLTQADVDAGTVRNTATAAAQDPRGNAVQSAPDSTVTTPDAAGALGLVKEVDATHDVNTDQRLDAGDTVDYSFVVTNTGTVTISALTVDDPKAASGGATVLCPVATLAPNARTTCTVTYTLTQADVDGGPVVNRARALGQDPAGGSVESPRDTATVQPDATSTLTIDKSAGPLNDADLSGTNTPGDTIAYSFLVTNTGATTLTDLAVVDSKVSASGAVVTCPTTTLAPRATTTCTATYRISQADIDAGAADNVASAAARGPGRVPVQSATDATHTALSATAAIRLVKKAAGITDTDGSGGINAGDQLGYTFEVTNTGGLTLHDVSVTDAQVAGVSCPTTTLAPGETVICSGSHRLTAADLAAGHVDNTATAAGTPPGGAAVLVSGPSSTITPIPAQPALSIEKQASLRDTDRDRRADAGERIRYTFLVTNTGNTTIDQVAVADPRLARAGVAITCPVTTLAVGQSTTCSATYRVTKDDLGGTIHNVATAQGTGASGGSVTSPRDAADVLVDRSVATVITTTVTTTIGNVLPDTGGPGLGLLAAAILLVAGGGWLTVSGRRQRHLP